VGARERVETGKARGRGKMGADELERTPTRVGENRREREKGSRDKTRVDKREIESARVPHRE